MGLQERIEKFEWSEDRIRTFCKWIPKGIMVRGWDVPWDCFHPGFSDYKLMGVDYSAQSPEETLFHIITDAKSEGYPFGQLKQKEDGWDKEYLRYGLHLPNGKTLIFHRGWAQDNHYASEEGVGPFFQVLMRNIFYPGQDRYPGEGNIVLSHSFWFQEIEKEKPQIMQPYKIGRFYVDSRSLISPGCIPFGKYKLKG